MCPTCYVPVGTVHRGWCPVLWAREWKLVTLIYGIGGLAQILWTRLYS